MQHGQVTRGDQVALRYDDATTTERIPLPRRPQPPGGGPRRRRPLWPIALVAVTVLVVGGAVAYVMTGGLRSTAPPPVEVFTRTGPLVHADALTAASATYQEYVLDEAVELRERTELFVAAVTGGRVSAARTLYPQARAHWERIQVASEVIGDLESHIDGQGVGLELGEAFTGFHRLERDLWLDGLQSDTDAIAAKLLADVTALAEGAVTAEFTGYDLCASAKELIDFAVVTTLTGRENRYAGTDISDLAARVEGSQAVVEALRPLLTEVDPALLATLDRRYAEALAVLDTHAVGTGYRPHAELSTADLEGIADALDALGEPVSMLGGTVMI